ncbi:hypothetical protein R1flu_029143 [Riccia fluitans]|uniref:RING-type domain-containing protein n=1 Tax=Riccia fluitans TaxID=41844 RepID=A0ABD1XP96_9MARC
MNAFIQYSIVSSFCSILFPPVPASFFSPFSWAKGVVEQTSRLRDFERGNLRGNEGTIYRGREYHSLHQNGAGVFPQRLTWRHFTDGLNNPSFDLFSVLEHPSRKRRVIRAIPTTTTSGNVCLIRGGYRSPVAWEGVNVMEEVPVHNQVPEESSHRRRRSFSPLGHSSFSAGHPAIRDDSNDVNGRTRQVAEDERFARELQARYASEVAEGVPRLRFSAVLERVGRQLEQVERNFNDRDSEIRLALSSTPDRNRGILLRKIRLLPVTRLQPSDVREDTCSICLEKEVAGEVVRRLPCIHVFHRQCIDKWLLQKPVCPTCKVHI